MNVWSDQGLFILLFGRVWTYDQIKVCLFYYLAVSERMIRSRFVYTIIWQGLNVWSDQGSSILLFGRVWTYDEIKVRLYYYLAGSERIIRSRSVYTIIWQGLNVWSDQGLSNSILLLYVSSNQGFNYISLGLYLCTKHEILTTPWNSLNTTIWRLTLTTWLDLFFNLLILRIEKKLY